MKNTSKTLKLSKTFFVDITNNIGILTIGEDTYV